jgi:monoamine oxidase
VLSLGAQSIAREIARLVGKENISLASPVVSINDRSSLVVVTTQNQKIFQAQKCILSVPSTMYKEFDISPPLPAAVQEVTNGTVLGDYNKLIMCYDKPWWRNEGFNGYFASYSGPITLGRDTSVDAKRHYSLTCFVNGLPGREWSKLPPHERRAAGLHQLAKVFKNNPEVFRPIEVFEQIWQHEEFSRGALAPVHAIGHLTKYASVYGRPVGNLHFVGTEYSSEWKGYMEGALCSGVDGAQQVVKALRKLPVKI